MTCEWCERIAESEIHAKTLCGSCGAAYRKTMQCQMLDLGEAVRAIFLRDSQEACQCQPTKEAE